MLLEEKVALNTYRYCGAIHIHTHFSDGTGNVDSISKAAKQAGLDWIIITDHNYIDAEEGIYNGVYVIKGEEISPATCNHYLAFGINKLIEPDNDSRINISNVRIAGGFGFAAHPDESLERKNKWCPIRWDNKDTSPDGVEIWNWFSSWGDNLDDSSILTLAKSYFFKHKMVTKPCSETLKWWDKLNEKTSRIIPAIGGADAHALKVYDYVIPLTIFPYKTCFKAITNVISLDNVLSEDFNIAKSQILEAVKSGNNVIVNRNVCKGLPEITISNSENTVSCGEFIKLTEDTFMEVLSEKGTYVKIIHDGDIIADKSAKRCRIPITKTGKYRAEISYKGRGYAYSNPIIVI